MSTGIVTWSKTAASNGTADSAAQFPEGMAPSAVNDSCRAAMASVAMYRDDISGSIVTAGTSTAYTVASNQVFAALTAGYQIAFSPHATNGATVTINVDGLGAKPLRSAPNVEITAGVLVQGTPYVAVYFTSNSGEWILQSFYGNPYSVPIGGMMPYVSTTAPNSSFVLPFGQAVSRTTYSVLFGRTSTSFGSGDGSTTFNLPDIRGRGVFGLDNMGGSTASRITAGGCGVTGTALGNTGGNETNTLITANLPAYTPSGTISPPTFTDPVGYFGTAAPGSGLAALLANNTLAGGTADVGSLTAGSVAAPTFTGSAQGGTSTAFSNLPPAIILPFIMRII